MANFSFLVGILGNIISMLVFASPIGTFTRVVKKRTTGNYTVLPYISTLLSTCLWSFYGLLKPNGLLIVTINGAGSFLQLIYVFLFLVFAPKDLKVKSMILVAIFNLGFCGAVVAVTLLAVPVALRLTFVGVLCAALTVCMYASPLTVMKLVIKTKSVEFMPFFLSFFLFLNAGVWSIYSLLVKDYFMAVPNLVGFVLGSTQLVLYNLYKNKPALTPKAISMKIAEEEQLPVTMAVPHSELDVTCPVIVEDMQGFVIPEPDEQPHADSGGGGGDEDGQRVLAQRAVKARTFNKGKSMPKHVMDKNPSSPTQVGPVYLRTLSLGPYDLQYTFPHVNRVDTGILVA